MARKGDNLHLTILHVPDCPNAAVLEARLAAILPDYPAVQVSRHVVTTEAQADRAGMAGSPTILADGIDPFARPGTRPSLSCRMYLDEHGRPAQAPSSTQLKAVLADASA